MGRLVLIPLLAAAALAGCEATYKPMLTPDGKQGFFITCDGSADDWTSCYAKAGEVCKGPYDIVDRNQMSTPTPYGPMVNRHMAIQCKQ